LGIAHRDPIGYNVDRFVRQAETDRCAHNEKASIVSMPAFHQEH
jgi:hypothetical protein